MILQRLLENSRVMYWFGIASILIFNEAMFSVFPPFYYGLHNAIMGWVTLLFVVLMHIFSVIKRCDQERSLWSYFYYFYHLVHIIVSTKEGSSNNHLPNNTAHWPHINLSWILTALQYKLRSSVIAGAYISDTFLSFF